MKLTLTGRHLTITDAVRQDIDRKLRRLERLLGDAAVSAQVVVERDAGRSVCEITVHARGDHVLRGVGRHARMTTAVAEAADKVARQARRVKDRWKSRRRSAPAPRKAVAARAAAAPPADGGGRRVIRSRARLAKPMSVDDAVLALDDAPRPFLVFRQPDAGSLAIVYRRPDGHIGLIEPED